MRRKHGQIVAGCTLFLTVLLSYWATAADQPPVSKIAPRKSSTSVERAAGAIRLKTDRPATERLQSARSQLEQGRTAEAIQLLSQLPADTFLNDGPHFVTGTWAGTKIRSAFSAQQRAVYDTAVEPITTAAWQRFLATPSTAELLSFCRDYGDTAAGLTAWQTVAARHRDQGQWSLAEAAWQRVRQHPRASQATQATAVLGQIEAAIHSHDIERAQADQRQHRDLLQTTVTISGQEVIAAKIAEQILAQTAPVQPTRVSERPALTPTWTIPLRPARDLGPHLDAVLQELRDNGVWPLPATTPLLADRLVLIRSHQALLALSRDTGETVWQVAFDDWPWIDSNPGILENAGYRTALLEQMAKRMLADSVMNRLTADAERVYVVQESKQSQGSPANFGAPGRNDGTSSERFNHLAAYRLDTGELAWKIGGPPAGPAYPLGGEFFCGPPTVVDDVLFVMGQQQAELQLLALSAKSGELLWKTTLGDLPRALPADPARQRIACPVVWQDGVLLCPTAAGAMIAVDPLTHAARWAYRYGVAARIAGQQPRNENTAFLADVWWNAWRDVTVKSADKTAMFVSPESDRLHALDTDTGRARWSMPREDGLMLLGVTDEVALVAEPTAIRGHALDDGRVLWRTPIGEVAGRGVVVGEHVVIPTSNGGVIRLRLRDGVIAPGTGTAESPLGNLIADSGTWFGVSADAVTAWPDLSAAGRVAEVDWQRDPMATGVALQAARRALEAGEATSALERLRPEHSMDARMLRKQAVKNVLQQQPERWTEFREASTIGSLSALEQVEWALMLSEAAAADDPVAAAEVLLTASLDAPVNGTITFDNPRRLVRPDLALSGAFLALDRRVDDRQRDRINEALSNHWNRAHNGTDPFAIQRLSERWAGWEFTRERLTAADDAPFLGLPVLSIELRLLEATGSATESVRIAALRKLIDQQSQNGFLREANDYRLAMLRGDHGPPGVETAKLIALRSIDDPAWPIVPPQIDSQRERNDDVHQFPIPLDVETSPLFDRLDVLMDRQGRTVRFSGGGVAGAWSVTLPASASTYRYLPHQTYGWGRGSLLILRVGFELFAIAPFNDRGEPQARVLWTLNTTGEVVWRPEQLRQDVAAAVPGVREDEYRVLDPYSRIVAQVGPVRPGYLCYAERAKLIAIDTLTGQRRWERFDLPTGFLLGGDDDVVSVWQPQTGTIEWLQATDGRMITRRTWGVSPDDVILQAGRKFWHRERTPEARLVCTDGLTATAEWSLPLEPGAVPFALSAGTLGIARPDGALTLLSAITGKPQASSIFLNAVSNIDRVVVSRDADRWYVAISERVPQQVGLQATQLRGGYRSPFVIGTLAAIDRDTGRVDWQLRLDREPWPIDQPRSTPLLMQVYKLPGTDLTAGRHSDGVVQLRDKRDGHQVFRKQHAELIGYAMLTADPDRAVVDLQLERETVRLRYRPLPPPPDLPER